MEIPKISGLTTQHEFSAGEKVVAMVVFRGQLIVATDRGIYRKNSRSGKLKKVRIEVKNA